MRTRLGACVRRARLQAALGSPMPTKHTCPSRSNRAAATVIISSREYSVTVAFRCRVPRAYFAGGTPLVRSEERTFAHSGIPPGRARLLRDVASRSLPETREERLVIGRASHVTVDPG